MQPSKNAGFVAPKKQQKRVTTARTVKAQAVVNPALNRNRAINLPRTPSAKPLHVDKKGKTQANMNKNLQRKSPWYQSIMDPAQGAGVKIPDDVAIETGTLQCCVEALFVTDATPDGVSGIRTISLLPNLAAVGNLTGINYQTVTPASDITAINWDTAAAFPTNPTLQSFAQKVRVTSAALYVESEASLSNASGEMIVGFTPYGYSNAPVIDSFRNQFGTSIMPLNVSTPMKVLWTPISFDVQTYSAFWNTACLTLGDGDGECPQWELFCLVSGVPAGVSFRARIIVNYEFVPLVNAIDIISANPSPNDSTEVNLVEAWVAETPAVRPSSTKEMSMAPSASIADKIPQDGGPSGFGMFVDVMTELAPFILDGVSMLL